MRTASNAPPNWKDLNPRLGISYDLFGNGKTAIKVSVARYVNGVGLAAGSITDNNNPETTVGLMGRAAVARPGRQRVAVRCQWPAADGRTVAIGVDAELRPATSPRHHLDRSGCPRRVGSRVPPTWNTPSAHSTSSRLASLFPAAGIAASFGGQTVTVDQRYDKSSYDGPFCLAAPSDPNLPGGGGYQVCGLYDLKPALVSLPPSSLLTFSSNYGGETNVYQGYDASLIARFKQGAFVQAGISATRRVFDECNLVDAGIKAVVLDGTAANIGLGTANAQTQLTEIYPDGTRACHQVYPYRPDAKILGSYTLPFDVQLSGTYQFTRGVQTGGAGPAILATWTAPAASVTQALGRPLSAGRPSGEIISLIQPGTVYGGHNLNQLDLRVSKRFRLQQYRFRVDFDAYNIFNSNWPFSVTNTFSTLATSQWLRPTNVLQSRFFKIGGQFDF